MKKRKRILIIHRVVVRYGNLHRSIAGSRPSLPRDAGQKVRGCAPRPSPQQTQVFHALQRRRVKRAGAGERRVFFSVTKKESRLTAGLRRQALPLLVLRHLVAHHVQPAFALHDLARVAQALDRGADLRRWRCGAGSRGRVRGAIEEEGWRRDCGRDPASAGLRDGRNGGARRDARLGRRPSSGARGANVPSSRRSRWRVDPGRGRRHRPRVSRTDATSRGACETPRSANSR